MNIVEILRIPRTLRWLVVCCVLFLCASTAAALTGRLSLSPPAAQAAVILAMTLAVHLWVLDSLIWSVAASGLVSVVALWFWASRALPGFGVWVAAFALLIAAALLRRLRWSTAASRIRRTLDELEEVRNQRLQLIASTGQAQQALEKKLNRYEELKSIAGHLSGLTDAASISQFAVERAFSLIGKSDACLLLLRPAGGQEPALIASKRRNADISLRAKQGDSFDHYVLRTQKPLLVNDVRRDYRFSGQPPAERPVASLIAAPLMMDERPQGLLRLDSAAVSVYTQDDLRLLDILLDLITTALTNARLFEQVQQLAITDSLTGLLLRRPWLEQLNRELLRAARAQKPLALLMLDVDHFKDYNDTYGHVAGDAVLRLLAELLRKELPADALCARYGGEEFAVVLPGSRVQAMKAAERLRSRFEQQTTPAASARQSERRTVTVSVGVSIFPDDAQADMELIRLADQRLYQAKNQGRNRVCGA